MFFKFSIQVHGVQGADGQSSHSLRVSRGGHCLQVFRSWHQGLVDLVFSDRLY